MAHWYAKALLIAALVAVVALAASGLGVRFGLWDFRVGFAVLRYATYAAIAVSVVSLVVLIAGIVRRLRGDILASAHALGIAALPMLYLLSLLSQAQGSPPIHDIATDLADPPSILPLDGVPERSLVPSGDDVRAAQRASYADIATLSLPASPADAFAKARDAAVALGFRLAHDDAAAGSLQAVATTFWFGFEDDVAVRVRASPAGGSIVDVRSVSRVGIGDAGANAKRVRALLAAIGAGV